MIPWTEPRECHQGEKQIKWLFTEVPQRWLCWILSYFSYHKDPRETTEWEDILAEKGIVPRKKVGTTRGFESKDIENALDEVLEERKEKVNPYEGRDLGELEDDLDVK